MSFLYPAPHTFPAHTALPCEPGGIRSRAGEGLWGVSRRSPHASQTPLRLLWTYLLPGEQPSHQALQGGGGSGTVSSRWALHGCISYFGGTSSQMLVWPLSGTFHTSHSWVLLHLAELWACALFEYGHSCCPARPLDPLSHAPSVRRHRALTTTALAKAGVGTQPVRAGADAGAWHGVYLGLWKGCLG